MQVFIKIRFKLIHLKQCGVPIYNPMSIYMYMYIDLPDNNCCLVSQQFLYRIIFRLQFINGFIQTYGISWTFLIYRLKLAVLWAYVIFMYWLSYNEVSRTPPLTEYILFISFVESFTVLFGFLSSTYYIKWQEWVMKNSTRLVLNYFSFLINTQGKKREWDNKEFQYHYLSSISEILAIVFSILPALSTI